jgi:hypothetical protein
MENSDGDMRPYLEPPATGCFMRLLSIWLWNTIV